MTDKPDRHREKMAKKKAVQDGKLAVATREKGLLIVHTGPGKGKTTAALGMALRALGHGMRVAVIQFIKGGIPTGEQAVAARLAPELEWHRMGEGFTWETQDKERDAAAARRAWAKAVELMRNPAFGVVVLDELNVALRYDQLPLVEVLTELRARRAMLHVVVTGRNAKPELVDLVTEMTAVKHPFRDGVGPQRGVEF